MTEFHVYPYYGTTFDIPVRLNKDLKVGQMIQANGSIFVHPLDLAWVLHKSPSERLRASHEYFRSELDRRFDKLIARLH
jgi:hypothetical protein